MEGDDRASLLMSKAGTRAEVKVRPDSVKSAPDQQGGGAFFYCKGTHDQIQGTK